MCENRLSLSPPPPKPHPLSHTCMHSVKSFLSVILFSVDPLFNVLYSLLCIKLLLQKFMKRLLLFKYLQGQRSKHFSQWQKAHLLISQHQIKMKTKKLNLEALQMVTKTQKRDAAPQRYKVVAIRMQVLCCWWICQSHHVQQIRTTQCQALCLHLGKIFSLIIKVASSRKVLMKCYNILVRWKAHFQTTHPWR